MVIEYIAMSILEEDITGVRRWLNEAGRLHRLDGPAVIFPPATVKWADESVTSLITVAYWYVNGETFISTTQFQKAAKLTDAEMAAVVLRHGRVEEERGLYERDDTIRLLRHYDGRGMAYAKPYHLTDGNIKL